MKNGETIARSRDRKATMRGICALREMVFLLQFLHALHGKRGGLILSIRISMHPAGKSWLAGYLHPAAWKLAVDDVVLTVISRFFEQGNYPAGTMVAVFQAKPGVVIHGFGQAWTLIHGQRQAVRLQIQRHIAIFLDADMLPVVIHALQSFGLEQFKTMQFLMAADFQIVLFQSATALFVEKFKDFIIKSHKVIAGNHLTPRLVIVWRHLPQPVISVFDSKGVPSHKASLTVMV